MKIVICGSMQFSREMSDLKDRLNSLGFSDIVIPYNTEEYALDTSIEEIKSESAQNKVKFDLIRAYYNEISSADAVVIANYDKNGIRNYIGGNSFLEAAFAHVLNKKLYFLFDIPKMQYTDELQALQPIVLNGNLEKIS